MTAQLIRLCLRHQNSTLDSPLTMEVQVLPSVHPLALGKSYLSLGSTSIAQGDRRLAACICDISAQEALNEAGHCLTPFSYQSVPGNS